MLPKSLVALPSHLLTLHMPGYGIQKDLLHGYGGEANWAGVPKFLFALGEDKLIDSFRWDKTSKNIKSNC